MKNVFESWNKFLKEEEINEVTEDELADIDEILHALNPDELSFNNIFGDKMRLITPMKTKNKNLEALKKTLEESGYVPDFSTGLATYYTVTIPAREGEKPITMILTADQKGNLIDDKGNLAKLGHDTEESFEKRKKNIQKKQIKIGKLLQKGSRLYDIAHKSDLESLRVSPQDFGLSPDLNAPGDEVKAEKYRKATGEAEGKRRKDLQKLFDVFQGYHSRASSALNLFQQLSGWWNKKSAFYREHPEEASDDATESGDYSIIYSRHPIDVLRMSDFENIESCHSPSSRGGGGEYYKCAVAEAHGHGFIAYVVKTSDLDALRKIYEKDGKGSFSDQEMLDWLEEEGEELFLDRERDTGNIEPVSRLRLKKYTNPALEISLAVPERRVYGRKFPDLVKNTIDWAKENQADTIKTMEASRDSTNPFGNAYDKDGFLNLGNFERHGGTYQDTPDRELFQAMFGEKATGSVTIDRSTEDSLEINPNLIVQWQEEVNEYKDNYNRRMSHIQIDRADVEDNGDGEAYIQVTAELVLVFAEATFKSSAFQEATRKAIEYLPQELIDYGYEWLSDYVTYTTIDDSSQDWANIINRIQDEEKQQIVIRIPIDIEHINPEGGGFAYSPDNFQEIAQKIDEADDQGDAVQELAVAYLKRSGILEGGKLHELARTLEDESWYEWRLRRGR